MSLNIYNASTSTLTPVAGIPTATLNNKANLTDLAAAFDPTVSYAVGAYVTYSGSLYRCTTAHQGAWSIIDFTPAKATEGGGGGSTYSAGTGIDITSDVISMEDPIFVGTT